jgi:hypothetical protein
MLVHGSCIESESFVVRRQCRWKEKKSDKGAKKKRKKRSREKVPYIDLGRSLKQNRKSSISAVGPSVFLMFQKRVTWMIFRKRTPPVINNMSSCMI